MKRAGMRNRIAGLSLPLAMLILGCTPGLGQSGSSVQPQTAATPKRVTAAMMGNPISPIDRFIGGRSGGGIPGAAEFAKMAESGLTVGKDNDSVFIPQLAEALPSAENGLWRVLPDGRMETTWKIRSGARWHDGVPLTSADLLFTAKLEQDKELPVVVDPAYSVIASIEAPDPQTVTVTWKTPFITADQLFSLAPIPQHILEAPYQANKDSLAGLP